jgi:hypothetical protein
LSTHDVAIEVIHLSGQSIEKLLKNPEQED